MSTMQIKSVIESLDHFKQNWKFKLLSAWPSIVGSLGGQVVLEKINDNSVVLGVVDSCWMQELYLLTPLVQSLINKFLDEPRIQKIYFKTKKTGKNRSLYLHYHPQQAEEYAHVPLSLQELKALAEIQDDELKRSLSLFRKRCSRNAKP
jgi:hypothetical protein